jgi:hypothetical protein
MAVVDGRFLRGAVSVTGRACSTTSVVGRPCLVIANFCPILLERVCVAVCVTGDAPATLGSARPAR